MDFYYYDTFDESLNYTLNKENKETIYQFLSFFGQFVEAMIIYYCKNIIILNTFVILFILCKIKMNFDEMFNEIEQMKIDIGYCLPTNKMYFEKKIQTEDYQPLVEEQEESDDYDEECNNEECNDEESDKLRVYLGKNGKCFHKNLECNHLSDNFKAIEIENKYISRLLCKSCK